MLHRFEEPCDFTPPKLRQKVSRGPELPRGGERNLKELLRLARVKFVGVEGKALHVRAVYHEVAAPRTPKWRGPSSAASTSSTS